MLLRVEPDSSWNRARIVDWNSEEPRATFHYDDEVGFSVIEADGEVLCGGTRESHRGFVVFVGSRELGQIKPLFGILRNRLVARLVIDGEPARLRQRTRGARWNSDHSYLELAYDLSQDRTWFATVTARWSARMASVPQDLVLDTDEGIDESRAAVALATAVLLPVMAEYGSAWSGISSSYGG